MINSYICKTELQCSIQHNMRLNQMGLFFTNEVLGNFWNLLEGTASEFSLQHICTSACVHGVSRGHTGDNVARFSCAVCTAWGTKGQCLPAAAAHHSWLLRWGTSGPEECRTQLLLMSLKTQLGRKLGMEQLTKITPRALWLILN